MDQNFLLKLALFFSCLGTMSLLFILHFYEVETVSVFDAKNFHKDSSVKIAGSIESVTKANNSTRIVVSSVEKITVVVFEAIDVGKYDQITVEGKVENYNGRAQIVADKIVKK